HQPRRRQHRRDTAPADGGRVRPCPRPRAGCRGGGGAGLSLPEPPPGSDPPGSDPPGDQTATEDRLLGGRVRLRQPAHGARAAIDPVFLAASIAAEPTHQILDAGCGSGAAMLCLAARVPQCRITGLEMQRDLVRLAGDNALLNGMGDRLSVMVGDLLQPPPRLSPGSFDHVMANPPFIERGRGTEAPNPAKSAANMEGEAALGDWVRFALVMVRAK